MKRQDVIKALQRQELPLRALGVRSLHLYGSLARDEAQAHSDVDLFADYDPESLGLIELVRATRLLEDALRRRVDLTTRDALHPLLRDEIERSALQIF